MKINKLMLTLSAAVLVVAGCKDKEIYIQDSPYITVTSPAKNQAVPDNDSIRVDAMIKPKSGSIVSYHVYLLDNEKREIYNKKTICDSKDSSSVAIDTAFIYDIDKTSNLLLHVQAELEDGTYLLEETPFKLVDTKK